MAQQASGEWVWDEASQDYYWREDEPKAPSPYDQLGMILAGVGAAKGGEYLGNQVFGAGGLADGLFGGGAAAVESPTLISAGGAAVPEAATAGSSLGLGSLATLAPYAGVAAGGALLAKGASDMINNEKTKGIGGWGGRATLGIATGGLSELAKAAGLFDHKSTRDVAKEHTSSLLNRFQDDPGYQSYVSGMREQHNSGPPDPSKPFAGGQYGTWDEYKKAGLQAGDLSGVFGNIDTFGQDWTKIDQKQREAVTQALIDADLYKSKKGEVEITDQAKAREIYRRKMAELLGS